MHPPFPERIHARFRAHALQLRPRTPIHLLRNLRQIDPPRQIHTPGVNPQNIRPRFHRRWRELDLAIDPPRAQERGVQDIQAIGGHDDLDVLGGFEPVELVQKFEHGALDLGIAAAAALDAGRTDAVDFVHEDDAGCVFAGHDEEFADHSTALADVFLDQFRTAHPDKFAVRVVRHCSRQEGFPGAGGAVEEDAFWLSDPERFEEFRVFEAEFDDFFDFFNLLVEPADHVIGAVGNFLNHH